MTSPASFAGLVRWLVVISVVLSACRTMGGEPHIQYCNRHFGYVLRPSCTKANPDALSPVWHHRCLCVDTPADVAVVAAQLRGAGIAATDAKLYPIYARTIGQPTSPTPMASA